jgi:hypothetical protein
MIFNKNPFKLIIKNYFLEQIFLQFDWKLLVYYNFVKKHYLMQYKIINYFYFQVNYKKLQNN